MRCMHTQYKIREYNGVSYEEPHACGQCMPCRVTHRSEWTGRIILQAKTTLGKGLSGAFTTLTMSDENLTKTPGGVPTLVKSYPSQFMKRLRVNTGIPLSHYHCGEYGDRKQRPHFHGAIFGIDIQNYTPKKNVTPNLAQQEIIRSWDRKVSDYCPFHLELLKAHQYRGFVDLKELNYARAAYIGNYMLKKSNKEDLAPDQQPEFAVQSRNPAIGLEGIYGLAEMLYKAKIYPEDMEYLKITDEWKSSPITSYRFSSSCFLPIHGYARKKLELRLQELTGKTDERSDASKAYRLDQYSREEWHFMKTGNIPALRELEQQRIDAENKSSKMKRRAKKSGFF